MAIINRTLDPSEQRRIIEQSYGAVATGATLHVAVVPYPAELQAAVMAVAGLSGSPTYDLRILRFIVGTGVTTFSPGTTTLTGAAVGTSGLQSFLLAANGSTLVALLANDVITVTSGAANTAVTNASFGVVLKALQDYKTSFGV